MYTAIYRAMERAMKRTSRNFHLPLPDDLYRKLRGEAEESKLPATVVARYAIDAWLRQRRRAVLREAIAAYAARMAGTGADLDPDLEAATLEGWTRSRRRRKR